MTTKPDRYYMTMVWLIIGGGTLLRIVFSATFLLVPDEAYYWQWSRHLALGYHDHPPMIAWTIRLATTFT